MKKIKARIIRWYQGKRYNCQCVALNKKEHDVSLYCQKKMGHFGKHIDICGDEW